MKRVISLILCFTLAFSLFAFAETMSQGEALYSRVEQLAEYLKQNHIDATEDDDPIKAGLIKMLDEDPEMYETFVNYMFQSYDKNSYFMNSETHELSFDYTTYVGGIGITMEIREDGAYILEVANGGAAEAAGLKAGDKLVSAEGVSLDGFTAEMIGEIIRGPVGSCVNITVSRDGEVKNFNVVRYAMLSSPVSAALVADGVAYMRIDYFADSNAYLDFTMLYKSLPEQGVKTVILDLRDNPGGALDVAINTIERLIPDKKVPYLMSEIANPRRVKTYTSLGLSWDATKMVILVNENTASSAELVAGVLHDLGYATLVGTTTYGKGTGQLHAENTETNEVTVVTNRRFYLPVSGAYDGIGLEPDVKVELDTKYYHLPKLEPLNVSRDILPGISKNALAIEQRLCELGYFSGKPDNVADGATFLAVNRFQYDNDIRITRNYCDPATARALDRAAIALDGTPVYIDTQYTRALNIAKSYAKNNTKPELIDMSKIAFGE